MFGEYKVPMTVGIRYDEAMVKWFDHEQVILMDPIEWISNWMC
jgi:hypothetical protein